MMPDPRKRFQERGSSFTSCLLTVIIVFGGLGFYYFNYFQWRHFAAPLDGLTYVDGGKLSDLNMFRQSAYKSVIDPALFQLQQLKEMRKASKYGKEPYTDLEQNSKEVRNALLAIMNEARLRRIPKRFKKHYHEALYGIVDTFDAVNLFEESFTAETSVTREEIYKKSFKTAKKAERRLTNAREFFTGKDWAN